MARDSEALRELDRSLRSIAGARDERRTIVEVFEREVAWLMEAHRARSAAAAVLIRHAGFTFGRQDPSDQAIFAAPLDGERARQAIARFHWFASHEDAIKRAGQIVEPHFEAAADAIVEVALVEALLDAGAAVDGAATVQGTPIATALLFGYPDAAEALARRGARVDDVVVAAGLGRVDLVERLAKPGARLDQAFRGGTVLDGTVWAARHVETHVDRVPVIRRLIAAGANVAEVRPRPVDVPAIEAVLAAAADG